MGKINFTPIQEIFFNKFSAHPHLPKKFYFTGGTALSVFYLNHRYSDDLDFFSENDFRNEEVISFINTVASELGNDVRFTQRQNQRVFELVSNNQFLIKIDFVHDEVKRLEEGKEYIGVTVDSLLDIGANKLLTINQRTEVKDFVDLYFLLKEFTIWDLMYAMERKFRMETDIILVASDMLKVSGFDFLPRMIKPLTLPDLKKFFREKAKELGKKAVY